MAETTPYVKQTWTDGVSSASAARFTFIEEGVRAAHEQPAVRVFHSANQSIVTATTTALAFNSERFDTAFGSASTQHDTVTNNNRLVCRYAGKYLIGGNVLWDANATGFRETSIRHQGTTTIATEVVDIDSSINHTQAVSTLYDLAVNEYVELMVFQNSGAGLNVLSSANRSPEFWMVRVA